MAPAVGILNVGQVPGGYELLARDCHPRLRPNSLTAVNPSIWSGQLQTRHHVPSRFGLCQRPVKDGFSRQWVLWRLWSNTKAQHRDGSMKNPGERSPGRGIGIRGRYRKRHRNSLRHQRSIAHCIRVCGQPRGSPDPKPGERSPAWGIVNPILSTLGERPRLVIAAIKNAVEGSGSLACLLQHDGSVLTHTKLSRDVGWAKL